MVLLRRLKNRLPRAQGAMALTRRLKTLYLGPKRPRLCVPRPLLRVASGKWQHGAKAHPAGKEEGRGVACKPPDVRAGEGLTTECLGGRELAGGRERGGAINAQREREIQKEG